MTALLPLLVIFTSAIVAMLLIACKRQHFLIALVSALGLGTALITSFIIEHVYISKLLLIDAYANMLIQGLLVAALLIIIFSYDYFKNLNFNNPEEFYLLLLFSTLGALIMACSNHFLSAFLGLELLTIPIYCLVSYTISRHSLEAGLKYIILAGCAGALFLFGLALIYAASGTMSFNELSSFLMRSQTISPLFLGGVAFVFAALAFKISAVPFHIWTPDVYGGAPLPATAFLATVSKAASLILFFRFWLMSQGLQSAELFWLLSALAILSMLGGNLLALQQQNIKRLLAYSSIAHFGYLIMAMIATENMHGEAFILYLAAYMLTILLIFGVLIRLDQIPENIADLKGLFNTQPAMALLLLLGFLSLMGLPLTALFMAKFLVIMSAVKSTQWLLLSSLVLSSAVGLFVYLRVINILFDNNAAPRIAKNKPLLASTLAILALSLLVLGIWPSGATNYIRLSDSQSTK